MTRTTRAAHVSTIKRRHGDRTYVTHLLRRTYRDGGKVKHETLANLSQLPDATIDVIRASLKGEQLIAASDAVTPTRSLPHGAVAAVVGALRKCGLEAALLSRPRRERSLVVALIASRILDPGSKLATARALCPETKAHTLGEVLDVESATEDELYAAMDWLLERQPSIEAKLAKKHLAEGCLVLYDVSGSHYTGRSCSLAKIGHPKDGRRNVPQINYGLLCDRSGCPIAIEVFEGNTGDPTTLKTQIAKVRERFGIKRVVFVSDRGLVTQARIREELDPVEGLEWISALRAPSIRKLVNQGAVQLSLFDERDLAEVTSDEFPGERLVACRNPLLADERRRKRDELLQSTEKELEKIAKATRRERSPLRGAAKIGVRLGKVLGRFKVGKHFETTVSDDSFSYQRNEQKIAEESALDGIYVVRTSLGTSDMSAEDVVRTYKDLAKVERAFRSMKTVDLHVRPIFHRLEERVRAHVFLCMLAYYVEWHMRRALAPILFDDDDREAGEKLRASVVAPSVRSPAARRKATSKRTKDGLPVHSFQTLLADLGTLARVRYRVKAPGADKGSEFERLTEATPVQRRAFELLGVRLG
jgi:transposase